MMAQLSLFAQGARQFSWPQATLPQLIYFLRALSDWATVCSMKRSKKGTVWKIAAHIPFEAEEAVIELFQRVFELPTSSYSDVETGMSTVAFYVQEKPQISAADRAELANG